MECGDSVFGDTEIDTIHNKGVWCRVAFGVDELETFDDRASFVRFSMD